MHSFLKSDVYLDNQAITEALYRFISEKFKQALRGYINYLCNFAPFYK